MRLRTHHKLFLSYSLLVAAVVFILTIGVDATLRDPLLDGARADLLREFALGRELYDHSPDVHPDRLARRMAEIVEHRVTIIARDGTVIGESDVPPEAVAALDNHADRPEFREALATGSGTAVRWSASVGEDLLYAATVSERGEVVRFAVGIAQIDQAVAAVRRQVLLVGLFALLLAGLFSLAFSFAVTRRLRHITATARAMAAGDLSARVRPHRRDELGDVGAALDTLAEQLQRRLAQLEGERAEMSALIDAMSEGVLALAPDGNLRRANPAAREMFELPDNVPGMPHAEVARRKPFLEMIRRVLAGEPVAATEIAHDGRHLLATAQPLPRGGAVLVFLDTTELRRLEGVRRDFVANASHELKTPLTIIRGYSETLLQEDISEEDRRRFAETLHASVNRLQRIVDDLLDLSKIESGEWTLQAEEISMEDVAREAWEPLAEAARRRGVKFRIEAATESRTLVADRGALRQVFFNLFDNALRYTPAGGSIEVRTRATDVHIRIEVIDTGSGIPSEHLGRIFERFYRVDPARSRAEGGTGLGLAIVRHLVERHGGRVEAESEVGKGTVIRLWFPQTGRD